MSRPVRAVALVAGMLLGLSACGGGGGGGGLEQAQTAEVLLTEEEFPLDGFTRGEVTEEDPADAAEPTEAPDDSLAALLEGQDVPQACLEALEAIELGDENITAESMVPFTGEESAESVLPTEVELRVAAIDGDSPLAPLSSVSEECGELEIEDSGTTLAMTFADLEDLEGTRITVSAMGQELEMTMGGRTEGDNVVAVLATGLTEDQVVQIVDAQVAKIAALE